MATQFDFLQRWTLPIYRWAPSRLPLTLPRCLRLGRVTYQAALSTAFDLERTGSRYIYLWHWIPSCLEPPSGVVSQAGLSYSSTPLAD
jgi:hypothetical protein